MRNLRNIILVAVLFVAMWALVAGILYAVSHISY